MKDNNVVENVEKLEPSHIADGKVNAALENSLAVPWKVKTQLPYGLEIPFHLREMKTYVTWMFKKLHTKFYSSIIYNSQNVETIQKSINQWMN